MSSALICGIGGQDGAYLARLLLSKGYTVWGTSRDAESADFENLRRLGILEQVRTISMTPCDSRSARAAISACEPDEIYALLGQSSVGLSFSMPVETIESIVLSTLNLLEAIRVAGRGTRLFHASSSECFGDLGGRPADEATPFRPRSPYGAAKSSAHLLVANYRDSYGLFAVNGILFNHESPLRPERFVTRKVTAAAVRIAAGSNERLQLGRLDISRDWGWAPEYVEAMWRMLQAGEPDDCIVATGRSHRLDEFVDAAFASVGLDWRAHVDADPGIQRLSELEWSGASPARIAERVGWRATVSMAEVAQRMTAAETGEPL